MKNVIAVFIMSVLMIFAATSESAAQVVRVRPAKPAKVLVKPNKPRRGYVWVDGHHRWNPQQRKYNWVKGRWVKARPGHVWVPGRWVVVKGKGHKWVPGTWRRR